MVSVCSCRAAAAFIAIGISVVSAQSGPALSALTVPAASLPDGCRLTPPPQESSPLPAAVLPFGARRFPSNPWFGEDYKYIAMVRPSFDPVPQMPDGPPLEKVDAARLKAKVQGDIIEAYHASYETALTGPIQVEADRYPDEKSITPDRRKATRIVRGAIVILITGNSQSECFKAVRHYIESLKSQ